MGTTNGLYKIAFVVVILWRQVPGVFRSQLGTNMPIVIVMAMVPTKITITRRQIKASDPNRIDVLHKEGSAQWS